MTPAPNRRWFRWSLRTMFVVVTVLCVWLGWNVNRVQQRRQMLDRIVSSKGRFVTAPQFETENPDMRYEDLGFPKMPILWSLLGAEPMVAVSIPEGFDGDEIRRLFPEADCIPDLPSGAP